ncbi:MAG: sensor domain-containing diguanylate cyclase [Nitrospirae bacterium]|nr:sensor domain-containing diguanylate cyclase [Nitrospirota bacterium]
MSNQDKDNNGYSSGSDEDGDGLTFEKLLSSDKWEEYFQELSKTLDVELSVYNMAGEQLFLFNENPFCRYSKSVQAVSLDCPKSCHDLWKSDAHGLFKCQAGLTCFSFPLERFNEKVCIVGRAGFSAYEDLLNFLKIVRDNNLPELPITMPFVFLEKDAVMDISNYISLSIDRQLGNVEAKFKLEEKLLRLMSLFDSQAFGTLSKNNQLMYRYVIDAIEFVFGKSAEAVMVISEDEAVFKTTYSTGKYKDTISDLTLDINNPSVKKMRDTRAAVFIEDSADLAAAGQLKETASAYFLPVFIGEEIDAIICIVDREFSREDRKILNSFREYVQLNLENQNLRQTVAKNRKSDEKLTYLSDITKSIVSILDKERLFNTLLEKSLQLINAEQGSLMILDNETSELVIEARKSSDDMVQEHMRFKKDEGISGMVLERGGSLLVEDIEKDPRIRKVNRPRYRTKSFVSVPIKIEDRLAGVLNLSDKIKGGIFNAEDLNLLESFVNNVAIAIERSILYKQTEKLQKLSITDHLTGIYNRRYLNRRLSEEITRYNRYKHPFSFMMLDLDKFKEYNDTFGHIAGDNLLKNLAHVMEKSLRTIDIAARFGGDEFVTIFPQTPKIDAIQISNRLKEKIDKSLSEHNIELPLSISVGLATFPDDASSIMELIEKTDQALYLAKKGGGNRVVYL